MAAHGLTILRQMRKALGEGLDQQAVVQRVRWGLCAPGTCSSVGFSFDLWEAIRKASDALEVEEEDVQARKAALAVEIDAGILALSWMNAYPTLEAITLARDAYVKPGTPHYNKRWRRFDEGVSSVHAKARRMIADRYPLDRRAPADNDW